MSDEGDISPNMQATRTLPIPAVEARDTPAGTVALLLAVLVGALLLVCGAVAGLLMLFDAHMPSNAEAPPAALLPPEPRLQVYEPAQRHQLEGQANAAIRPGIDRAMASVAGSGWPEEAGNAQ